VKFLEELEGAFGVVGKYLDEHGMYLVRFGFRMWERIDFLK